MENELLNFELSNSVNFMGIKFAPWYELSYVANVVDAESQRQADNSFKIKSEEGFYTAELWAHLRRARLSIGGMIARWLTPQPPSVLQSKEMLVQAEPSAEIVLNWLRENTRAREGIEAATPWPLIVQLLRAEKPHEFACVQNVCNLLKTMNYQSNGEGQPKLTWKGHKGRALTHNSTVLTLTNVALPRLNALLGLESEVVLQVEHVVDVALQVEPVVDAIVPVVVYNVHDEVQSLMSLYANKDSFGFFVHRLAAEFVDYSVGGDGFRDAESLLYKLVAMGFDCRSRLAAHYQ